MKKNTITLLLFGLLFSQTILGQWTSLPSGTTEDLFDIDFIDAQHGVAVGNNATILITSDGGNSWKAAQTGDLKESFHSVQMISTDTILAAAGTRYDGRFYRSTDGGQSWDLQFPVSRIVTTSAGTVGFDHKTVYYSSDTGESWDTTSLSIGSTVLMEEFRFSDPDTGHLVGNISGFSTYSAFGFRTVDGGQNWAPWWVFDLPNNNAWTSLATPHPDTVYLYNNRFVNFLPGNENQLVRLTDFNYDADPSRNSWRFTAEIINANMPGLMISSHFLDARRGFAGSFGGDIYASANGGQSWALDFDGDTSIFAITAVNDQLLYAVGGNGTILRNAVSTNVKDRPRPEILRFFPNPVREELSFRNFPGREANAVLRGIDGRLIRTFPWKEGYAIRVNDLVRGAYVLELRSGNLWYQGRFLKQ